MTMGFFRSSRSKTPQSDTDLSISNENERVKDSQRDVLQLDNYGDLAVVQRLIPSETNSQNADGPNLRELV